MASRTQAAVSIHTLHTYANAPNAVPINNDSTNLLSMDEIAVTLQAQWAAYLDVYALDHGSS